MALSRLILVSATAPRLVRFGEKTPGRGWSDQTVERSPWANSHRQARSGNKVNCRRPRSSQVLDMTGAGRRTLTLSKLLHGARSSTHGHSLTISDPTPPRTEPSPPRETQIITRLTLLSIIRRQLDIMGQPLKRRGLMQVSECHSTQSCHGCLCWRNGTGQVSRLGTTWDVRNSVAGTA